LDPYSCRTLVIIADNISTGLVLVDPLED